MENEAKKTSKVWLIPTIVAAILLVGLIVFMVIMGKGTTAVADGTQTLAESVAPLKDGTAQLSDGVNQYTDGVDQVADGVALLNDNVPTLSDGVQQLADGSVQLKDGVKQYTEGTDQVADGIATLQNGVPTLSGGIDQLAAGAAQLNGYKDAMNGVADQIASGLKGVRKTVNDNKDYKLLLTGANGVAEQLDVNKSGSLAQAIMGMDGVIDQVDSSAKALSGLSANAATLGQLFVVSAGGEAATAALPAENQITFDKVAATALTADQIATLKPFYTQWVAYNGGDAFKTGLKGAGIAGYCLMMKGGNQTDAANMYTNEGLGALGSNNFATDAAAFVTESGSAADYIFGMAASGATVTGTLNSKNDQLGGLTPVGLADTALGAVTLNKEDPTKNIHTAATQVAGGIPQVIDTVCDGLEDTAKSLTETKTGKSLKSQLAAYTGGVSALNDGLATLKASVPALAGGIKQLFDGSQQLKANSTALRKGSSDLADGTKTLNDAVPTLTDGIKQLFDGTKQLKENSGALRDGAKTLKDSAPALIDGIGQLVDGAKQVKGMVPGNK